MLALCHKARGETTMSIRIGSVAIGMTAAMVVIGMMVPVIVTIDGAAWAKDSPAQMKCNRGLAACDKICEGVFPSDKSKMRACQVRCLDKYVACGNAASTAQKSSGNPTGNRPKGKGPQESVNVDPVKQVYGGTKLKDKVGQHNVDLGGAQQLQQSGVTSGKSTIMRTKKR
jgi:hypothetical protein